MDLSLKTKQATTISDKENLSSLRSFRMSQKVERDHRKTSVIVRQANTIDEEQSSEEKTGDNSYVECPVCAELTINHSHYGGVVCDSCKAFFRRTVVNPSKKSERCRLGKGKCSLRKERRNNCPYCRFKLCLQTGMKPDMIKIRITPIKASVTSEITRERRISPLSTDCATENQIKQILKFHDCILTQTSGVNLMTIPGKFLKLVDERISSAETRKDQNQDTISIARLEYNFLKVKQKQFESQKQKTIFRASDCGSQIFTAIQELLLELVILFMKQCRFFQALTWDCTSRLLRKNITDITVLLLMMSYDREKSQFRCLLSSPGFPVEVDRLTLTRYFGPDIAADIFQVVRRLHFDKRPEL